MWVSKRGTLSLESVEHRVTETREGLEALEKYASDKPDLVMPGLSGLEVVVKLRKMDPGARIIVATSFIHQSPIDAARLAGESGFFNKSCFLSYKVLAVVNAVLGGGCHDRPAAGNGGWQSPSRPITKGD
jgi:two-component system chemotaxis response regulator CheY